MVKTLRTLTGQGFAERKLKLVSISFFRIMKSTKKSHVGAAKAPMLLSGVDNQANGDLDANPVVFYLPGLTKR